MASIILLRPSQTRDSNVTKSALIAAALLSALILTNASIFAQAPGTARPAFNYEAAQAERVATAVRITDEITLDGRLDEKAWALAVPATDFYQWVRPGLPASNKTEARFLYDDENLYVGVNMWDKDIEQQGRE